MEIRVHNPQLALGVKYLAEKHWCSWGTLKLRRKVISFGQKGGQEETMQLPVKLQRKFQSFMYSKNHNIKGGQGLEELRIQIKQEKKLEEVKLLFGI